jgi:hypothetical protein
VRSVSEHTDDADGRNGNQQHDSSQQRVRSSTARARASPSMMTCS